MFVPVPGTQNRMDWRLLVKECISNKKKTKEIFSLCLYFLFIFINSSFSRTKMSVFANQSSGHSEKVRRGSVAVAVVIAVALA